MNLQGIMQSEISQTKQDILWFHLYVESKEQNKHTKKEKQTYKYPKQTDGCQREGEEGGRVKWMEGLGTNWQL